MVKVIRDDDFVLRDEGGPTRLTKVGNRGPGTCWITSNRWPSRVASSIRLWPVSTMTIVPSAVISRYRGRFILSTGGPGLNGLQARSDGSLFADEKDSVMSGIADDQATVVELLCAVRVVQRTLLFGSDQAVDVSGPIDFDYRVLWRVGD